MLVGSFASMAYGEPRLTNDIDIVVRLDLAAADRLCAAFPAPDFYVSQSAAREAVLTRGQFNVIHPPSGNKIDFMIARDDPWGRSQLARRVRKPLLPNRDTFVAAPVLPQGRVGETSPRHCRHVAGQRRRDRQRVHSPLGRATRPHGTVAGRPRPAAAACVSCLRGHFRTAKTGRPRASP